jgi:hypothetical protein
MHLVVPALLEAVRPVFHSCHTITATLAETIPRDEVWKWRELWIVPLRAAVFSVVLAYFLTDGTLASLSTVAEQLGSTSAFSSTPTGTLYTLHSSQRRVEGQVFVDPRRLSSRFDNFHQ